jgi:glycosyltransferase involved in cell wall biosynthesis
MRILINTLFLVSESLGGSWTLTAQLVRNLTCRKGNLEYVVLVNDAVADRIPVSDIAGTKVVIPLNVQSRAKRILWEQTMLPWIVHKYKPDLYHTTGNILPLAVPCKTVATILDLQVLYYPENFPFVRRNYLRTMLPLTVRRADRVVAISEFVRQDILKHYPVRPEKVVAIPLAGLTPEEAACVVETRDIRAAYDLPSRFLLSVGGSYPHKNLVRMVEAYASVADEIPDILLIVGEAFGMRGPLMEVLERTGLQARGKVRTLPFLPRADVLALYRAAHAYVFPSLFEGFGIPALEAMDCGCPVLASNGTALAEVVGDAGLVFDPLDMRSIASAMRTVSLDAGVHDRLIALGHARAREFSWKKNADRTVDIFNEVLGT